MGVDKRRGYSWEWIRGEEIVEVDKRRGYSWEWIRGKDMVEVDKRRGYSWEWIRGELGLIRGEDIVGSG